MCVKCYQRKQNAYKAYIIIAVITDTNNNKIAGIITHLPLKHKILEIYEKASKWWYTAKENRNELNAA
jgi:hypothetical protein